MWEFGDDTEQAIRTARRPRRVVAYVRAGAALHDLGVTPVAVYGSGHDGDRLDPAKAGALAGAGVPYLGPGKDLTDDALGALRPDLVVDLTYDGKNPYAMVRPPAAPLLALSVAGTPLPAMLARFRALAAALRDPDAPAPDAPDPVESFRAAERAVRDAPPARVLALSGAGDGQVHLARPGTWPELCHLAGLGVRLIDPDELGPGGGVNWFTTDWERAARLRPDVLLVDDRAHAAPPPAAAGTVTVVPWNPETPPSPAAYARFLRAVARGLTEGRPQDHHT
ncbi:ABC transporter substrate-binding protein [Streptomyces sp. WAC05374]|nr:ABC transporter substrate-binding protein [Streptomyces sp. WAC05374]TDF40528.1 ABC transporter substrate-binding protein [Streptomyces sp. WAC05374]TDF49162.1 ABC transporter substrate-binding protein [Streptomyces sp. WAC05374]TDF49648.1 ABC transporter substrate-binding protein [Streptomyces sp. WAC05374]